MASPVLLLGVGIGLLAGGQVETKQVLRRTDLECSATGFPCRDLMAHGVSLRSAGAMSHHMASAACQPMVDSFAASVVPCQARQRQQRMAEQVEIADGVENLVFDEFVAVTQAVLVQYPEFVEDDGVFQTATQGKAVLAQIFDLLHEAEGTGARHLANIGLLGEIDFGLLGRLVDGRMVEDDREIKAEAVIGRKARPFVAVLDLDRHRVSGRVAADREAGIESSLESLQAAARDAPLLLAGNALSPAMVAQLGAAEAQPVTPLRAIGLGADGIAGAPLWLRAEPGEDAAMAAAIAADVAAWSKTCGIS